MHWYFSGGSAFGLDAAGGVQAGLREIGRGLQVGSTRVPIVPQAILMDMLNGGNKDWGCIRPIVRWDMRLSRRRAVTLSNLERRVQERARRPRLSRAGSVRQAPSVLADTRLRQSLPSMPWFRNRRHEPPFLVSTFEVHGEFGDHGFPARFTADDTALRLKGVNLTATTIGAVVTDAVLTKAQAHRLSIMAHDGLARAVLPAHLPSDGDTMFAAATGDKPQEGGAHFAELCYLATIVMARAVARGVYEATALPVDGAQRAYRDIHGRGF